MTPKVSILIPSYNHARFLPACLESIQNQTFSDWEVLLVDDGSRDESVELAREWSARDPRLQVHVNPENLGTYGTEERARQMARGEYIAVMNSDDLWHPEKLARQVARLDSDPSAVLCYVLGWMVDDSGQELGGEDVHADWPRDRVQDPLPYLLIENRILASGVLFRRDRLRFEPTCRYSGDWVALLEHAAAGRFACEPDRLTFWRQHENNTYLRSPRQIAEEIRVRRTIDAHAARWLGGRWPTALVQRGLALNLMNLFVLEVYLGDRAAARRAGWRAAQYPLLRRSSLKRTLSGFLPLGKLRSYFYPGEPIDWTGVDRMAEELHSSASRPLELRV